MILAEFSETDRKNYNRLHLANLLRPDRNEGYRQGGIGTWYDAMIPVGWPIPLEEIKTKVHLWQGEEDISVPLAMGQYFAKNIPECEAIFIKGFGHLWIFEHMGKMLEKLVPSASSSKL
ncbi:alpha/beta fold hydrolase [Chloroflexota bacterium]